MLPAYLWGIETLKFADTIFRGTSLPAYLWGIETIKKGGLPPAAALLPAYLWGIETPPLKWIAAGQGCCQPTYEELKPIKLIFMSAFSPVASLPMRNWNHGKRQGTLTKKMLPAYLWGIETWPALMSSTKPPCCQPTYEELKPHFLWRATVDCTVASLPMRNWNFSRRYQSRMGEFSCQPTYEELKRYRPVIQYNLLFRCQPTYEELKPAIARNNRPGKKCCQPTYEELKHKIIISILHYLIGCQPTYEELKLKCDSNPKRVNNSFPVAWKEVKHNNGPWWIIIA